MRSRTIFLIMAAVLGAALLALAIFAATFDANRYKPELIELVGKHTGRRLTLDGDLSLSLWPRIGLSTGRATLSGADGKGEAARFESGRVAVAIRPLLSQQLVVEGLRVQGLRIALGDPGDGAGWRLEDASLATGRIGSGEQGRLELEGRLRSSGSQADLAATVESAYRIQPDSKAVLLEDLAARLDGPAFGFERVRARLAAGLRAELASRTLEAQALSIEASLPDGPGLALSGTGRLVADPESAELALQGKLDDTALKVSANVSRFAPLAFRYTLEADRLDLDRLRERLAKSSGAARPAQAAGTATPDSAAPRAAGEAPSPARAPGPAPEALPAIAGVDSRGALKVERLLLAGLTVENLSASVTTGGNRISIEPASARLNGGALRARVSMTDGGHRLVATLAGVDAGALIRDAARRDVLDGHGDMAVDLTARGQSGDALTRSLAGSASLELRDGAVKGIDLDRLMRQVRAALDGRLPVEERAKSGERTPFRSLSGSFRLAEGVARSEDVALRADWLGASGVGAIDLGAQSLDWLIRASVTGTPPGSADPARRDVFDRLKGLTVPIRLTGRYDDLRYRVDVGELATDAAKREIRRRIEERIGEQLGQPPADAGGAKPPAQDPLQRLKDLLRR